MGRIVALIAVSLVIFGNYFLSGEKIYLYPEPLIIHQNNKEISLSVSIATTSKQLKNGLMHRKSMPEDSGMLFDSTKSKPVVISMWMKNTYISLDMLFIAKDGTIISMAKNAKPLSLDVISSQKPASAVLEINGGQIDKLGIKVGNHIEHPIFK